MTISRIWNRIASAFMVAASLLTAGSALADRGRATAEEKERVVKLAAAADKDPIGTMRSPEGRWFEKWADEVPDYMFGPDAGVFWFHNGVAKADLARVLRFHHTVTTAAFQVQKNISDPMKDASSMEAKTIAGIEGLLRAYEILVAKNPENKVAAIDDLLVTRNKGGLSDFVKKLPPLPKR